VLDPALLPAFMLATLVLLLIPGPNVALIVANSVAYGARYGLLTVAGTSAAMVVQLGLTGLGMAGLLGVAGSLFGWVRWLGVISCSSPGCGSGVPRLRTSPAFGRSRGQRR